MKKLLKRLLYLVAYYSGGLRLLIAFLSRVGKNHRAAILFYHRFRGPGEGVADLLPRLNCREFDRQMAYLRKTYEIVSLDDAVPLLREAKGFRRPSVILTIDDGYRDNYTLAYPIIRKHDLPVTIYLTAGMIGGEKGLWIDDIEYALRSTGCAVFNSEKVLGEERIDISTHEKKKAAEKKLYAALAKKGGQERKDALRELFEALNVPGPSALSRDRIMMNWEEVNEMVANSVNFGAHTVSHPFLPLMPLDEAKREIQDSKLIIEEKTGKTVRHFAVPNGKNDDFSPELSEFCREIGFDTVVTTEPGVVGGSADTYSLARVLPPPPTYYFACELARYLFRRNA
jgi:peptidoglycan/xylan/chitin deacetylase (PgdA/CDA1 family)